MNAPTTFYSASAGSGKTYTLARDYLTLLFKHDYSDGYRRILAVTFTNKAVAEMKERILMHLENFTLQPIPKDSYGIFNHIVDATGSNPEATIKKARQIHKKLLHDYSAFDIVTIDAFNHRILRTFARDINLDPGFEVALDTSAIISKAINRLIARAGSDSELTDILVNFSLSKIDQDKSWDISYDLENIADLIKNENHYPYLVQLKDKSIKDFKALKKTINKAITESTQKLESLTSEVIDYFNHHGLTQDGFTGKSRGIYPFLVRVSQGKLSSNPESKYLIQLTEDSIAHKDADDYQKNIISNTATTVVEIVQLYRSSYSRTKFYENVLKRIVPISLINELLKEIDAIKEEEQLLPIYEFNGILAKEIKDQPAPFIYERLGEKYRHYFIDEFQDTSTMQWHNLEPLVSNALVSMDEKGNTGSLMLVGDAKQSIYRWRGGDADQFLTILNNEELFQVGKKNETLGTNWRSYDQIIHFNNAFFEFYGNQLQHPVYQQLYLEFLHQEPTKKTGGYIQFDLLNEDAKDLAKEQHDSIANAYPLIVLEQIEQAVKSGFQYGEICILVRRHSEGHEIAQFLTNEHDIKVVSGQSLLVHASNRVQLLVSALRMIQAPDQPATQLDFLLAYSAYHQLNEQHEFIKTHLNYSVSELCKRLMISSDGDVYSAFAKAQLFNAIELTASSLNVFNSTDPRLQAFLEFAYTYSNGYEVSLSGFLEEWDQESSQLSVPATPDDDAITVMTIHKSKGLEFPVVIVPHLDAGIEDSKNDTGWIPVPADDHAGFDHLYIGFNKEVASYPENASTAYQHHVMKVQMDHINLLYVAFTRSCEHLYLSGTFKKQSSGWNYAQLLEEYFEEHSHHSTEDKLSKRYHIGNAPRVSTSDQPFKNLELSPYQVNDSTDLTFSTRKGLLWATGANTAIIKGNLLHDYMASLSIIEDLPVVINKITADHSFTSSEREELITTIQNLVKHPDFADYFKNDQTVINEHAILTPQGQSYIPDRLIVKDNHVTIIDYKTGQPAEKYQSQLNHYAQLLIAMGYQIDKKVLLYTDQLKQEVWN